MGVALTLIASMLLFSALESRPVLHEIVIAVFVILTTPVTFMLLVRAAVHRDRAEGNDPTARPTRDPSRRGTAREKHVTAGLGDDV
jgi:multicomponent K+:H+ antiporter subunit G